MILPTLMKREIYAHTIKCFIINIAELEEKLPSPLHFTKTIHHSLHILIKYFIHKLPFYMEKGARFVNPSCVIVLLKCYFDAM